MNTALMMKTFAFLLIVPGTVAVIVPLLLVCYVPIDMPLALGPFWRYCGGALVAIGVTVYLRCSFDLARFGQGIPAPTEPTRFLVRRGIYRRVRNPMYIAGSLVLCGEAVASARGVVLLYAIVVSSLYHLGVVFLEEPALRKRFGAPYERYCRQVPRWLFRFTASEPDDGAQ